MTKIAGSGSKSGSGFISQRHGSNPDLHQNVMDPERSFVDNQVLQFRFVIMVEVTPSPPPPQKTSNSGARSIDTNLGVSFLLILSSAKV
jgi:hypothetical protein